MINKILLAIVLMSQGVVQSFSAYKEATLLEPQTVQVQSRADAVTTQVVPLGPVASQVAIKQLGTNGGGFFNANSAHPFENPTPLSNFLEVLAILLIPAALCYTFGRMVGDTRQGWAILAAMPYRSTAGPRRGRTRPSRRRGRRSRKRRRWSCRRPSPRLTET